MGLKGNLGSIKGMKAALRAMPLSVAHNVAQKAAPAMTALTQAAFTGNQNVYGDARPAGVNGQPLTLVKSGDTQASLKFVANGTIVRAVLGTKYAKFLVGRFGILPNGALPVQWSRRLGEIVSREKALGQP